MLVAEASWVWHLPDRLQKHQMFNWLLHPRINKPSEPQRWECLIRGVKCSGSWITWSLCLEVFLLLLDEPDMLTVGRSLRDVCAEKSWSWNFFFFSWLILETIRWRSYWKMGAWFKLSDMGLSFWTHPSQHNCVSNLWREITFQSGLLENTTQQEFTTFLPLAFLSLLLFVCMSLLSSCSRRDGIMNHCLGENVDVPLMLFRKEVE